MRWEPASAPNLGVPVGSASDKRPAKPRGSCHASLSVRYAGEGAVPVEQVAYRYPASSLPGARIGRGSDSLVARLLARNGLTLTSRNPRFQPSLLRLAVRPAHRAYRGSRAGPQRALVRSRYYLVHFLVDRLGTLLAVITLLAVFSRPGRPVLPLAEDAGPILGLIPQRGTIVRAMR